MRIAYADPPYPGQAAKLYGRHADYAGEVDHAALVEQLATFDAWVLHTSSNALSGVLALCPSDARVLAWVKPFCSWKRGQWPAYAWEPVVLHGGRGAIAGVETPRDYLAEPITLRRGLHGAKPQAVVWWLLDCLGAEPGDELDDLFPGTGAVERAWQAWRRQPRLALFGPLVDSQTRAEAPLFEREPKEASDV